MLIVCRKIQASHCALSVRIGLGKLEDLHILNGVSSILLGQYRNPPRRPLLQGTKMTTDLHSQRGDVLLKAMGQVHLLTGLVQPLAMGECHGQD